MLSIIDKSHREGERIMRLDCSMTLIAACVKWFVYWKEDSCELVESLPSLLVASVILLASGVRRASLYKIHSLRFGWHPTVVS